MLKKLQSIFKDNLFLFLVLGPYLIKSAINIPFTNSFAWLVFCIILLEICYQKLNMFILNRYAVDITVFIIPSILVIFYYEQIILLNDYINSIWIKLPIIRIRYFLPFSWIVLIVIYYKIRSILKGKLLIIQTFLFILSLSIFVSPTIKYHLSEKPNTSHSIQMNNSYTKPVILLILDEYSSPTELYKNNPDTSLLEFSNRLISSGWEVNNTQYSNDLSTINSLSSLFNYNFKFSANRSNINQGIHELRGSSLIHHLEKKGVKIYNFGIFDIGSSKAFSKIYYYENVEKKSTFLRQLFAKSLIAFLYDSIPGVRQSYHNRYLIENSYQKIKKLEGDRVFIYLHLLMPHSPLNYKGHRKFESSIYLNRFENYERYWRFTNSILQAPLINSLVRNNAFKIIITGDHGYRGEPNKVNPHITMTAYYGFERSQTLKIKSVQDLGSLIHASY